MEETCRTNGFSMTVENQDVLCCGEPELCEGYIRVPIDPQASGETQVTLQSAGEELTFTILRVGWLNGVYDFRNSNYTGDAGVLMTVTLFWCLVSLIMLWHFFQAKGAAFYSYATVYYAGFSLFALVNGLLMIRVTVARLSHSALFSMVTAYSVINSASTQFMMLTMPIMLLFAAAMAVSNLALLRHEKPRLQNILGILVALFLMAGEAVGWYLFTRDFLGSELEARIDQTLQNTYATVFVYFECMLMGAVICGLKTVRSEPAPDKDFIIILGCWFRPDGSLPPLLKGRVDRAIAFWRRQQGLGREAFFIPSGGKGRDEPMPESEAMQRYLVSQGIPPRLILQENRSANTYENMAFSREIMERVKPEGKAVFSTTNYHVFRSGIWAAQAGLAAEGIGSRTKWWFWPNAFMRETVGLLQKRWKQELFFLMFLIAFFALLSMMLA